MKNILFGMMGILALILGLSVAHGAPIIHSQNTNTNAQHQLHLPGYSVSNYAGLQAVTNMWCGDQAFEQDNGQQWLYQCSGGPNTTPTPGVQAAWVPFNLGSTPTPVFTATNTITWTPTNTSTFTNTLTSTVLTSTPTLTFTPSPTPTGSATPTYTKTLTPNWTTTQTAIISATGTTTPTFTYTQTGTVTPTYTFTNTLTFTQTYTSTPSYTFTPIYTNTFTPTVTFTFTPSLTPPPVVGNTVILPGKYVGSNQSAAISWASGQATYSLTAHGFSVGDWVVIAGATPTAYNIMAQITSAATNTFTYAVGSNPTTVSTGTSKVLLWFDGTKAIKPWKINSATSSGTGVFAFTFVNTQPNAYWGFLGSCNDGSSGNDYVSLESTSTTGFTIQTGSASGTAANPSGYIYLRLENIQ